jgi:DNA polymerase-3 subunit delta'
MAAQPQILEKQITLINELIQLVGKPHFRKINFAQNLIKSSQKDDLLNIESIMDFWLAWFRDLLLIKKHCDDLVVNFIQKENLIRQAQNYNTKQIESFIFRVSQTKEDLRQNISPKLAIENLIFCISQGNVQ